MDPLKKALRDYLNRQGDAVDPDELVNFIRTEKERLHNPDAVKLQSSPSPNLSLEDELAAEFPAYEDYKHIKPIDAECDVEECDISLQISIRGDLTRQYIPFVLKSTDDYTEILFKASAQFQLKVETMVILINGKAPSTHELLFPITYFLREGVNSLEILP
jgi:hypothetical protein